ncbi:hypothetical protein Back11_45940 [Paenibacillus baekrokdamisoli]|uniref:Copper amine oxidase-like N-terminal domain-containing protein n=1 Tax=Paenibacillus baekrokdamisoli TaxID=1712516 RepID=A0A3G9JJP2_9BACL|nr:stalk domain-containing protein [Paenibacillus baekrokdamisoli]MBB3072379.1 hypothetical protein [Paenibacillus baekrokdamisoli]BBH23249.1 hypothetical protein Back11_45940 [Paenibacillus baekrokdamisoli]
MFRKGLIIFTSMLFLFIATTPVSAASTKSPQTSILLILNGQKVQTVTPPVVVNGSVFVPLNLLWSLGFSVTFSKDMQIITVKKYTTTSVLTFESLKAKIGDTQVTLPHKPTIINGSRYISAKTIGLLDSNIQSIWDGKIATLSIVDYGLEMEKALQTDDLSNFQQLLKNKRINPEWALDNVMYNQKGTEWASAAIERVTNVLQPFNYFERAINLRRIDIVKLMLDKGKVDVKSLPATMFGYSYVGLAYLQLTTYVYDPTKKKAMYKYNSEPSFELAELLYERGLMADNADAYYTYSDFRTGSDWLDWMLSHGADPDGETVKMVYLDQTESNISFYHAPSAPDPTARQKLIISAYLITTWSPSPEQMEKLKTLVVDLKANLDPLTQAQKDRLLYLANSNNMTDLAHVLIGAGAV